ncbi:hypothetical protein OG225_42655 (plasmid) [Nocardia sp. NBC_01377]|uniref:hypothetical protein n=1 Tax=Nocardia sp. NBC_01377 TaxID=2903595 RepID=UPI003245712B
MSSKANDDKDSDSRVGGLPADDSLSSFAAAASGAIPTRRSPRPADASVGGEKLQSVPSQESASHSGQSTTATAPDVHRPDRTSNTSRRTTTPPRRKPAPAAVNLDTREFEIGSVTVTVTDLGPSGQEATDCLVNVNSTVRQRFTAYQTDCKLNTGKEPSNGLVVRRAFTAARKEGADVFAQMLASLDSIQVLSDEDDDDDPDGILGPVPGRRVARGRMKDSAQQSFRPSKQELATYDAVSDAFEFPSRSDFISALLDYFLPPLPTTKTRRARKIAPSTTPPSEAEGSSSEPSAR